VSAIPSYERGIHLTATFFCEITTAQSLPLTPMEVMLAEVMALNAYSGRFVSGNDNSVRIEAGQIEVESSPIGQYIPTWYNRPWSEKMVICLS
jgi:hypothetical protein